jgi:hypothetical protein
MEEGNHNATAMGHMMATAHRAAIRAAIGLQTATIAGRTVILIPKPMKDHGGTIMQDRDLEVHNQTPQGLKPTMSKRTGIPRHQKTCGTQTTGGEEDLSLPRNLKDNKETGMAEMQTDFKSEEEQLLKIAKNIPEENQKKENEK